MTRTAPAWCERARCGTDGRKAAAVLAGAFAVFVPAAQRTRWSNCGLS